VAGHTAGAVVAEVGLLRPAARVREIQAHRGAFSFADFPSAVIADEHCLASQLSLPSLDKKPRILRSFSRAPYPERSEQAEQRQFLTIESDIACADDAQMAWTKVINSSPVEILLDDRRADV
jgi:hypothetical protein